MPFLGGHVLWCTNGNPGYSGCIGHHGYPALDIGMPVGTRVYASGPGRIAVAGSAGDARGTYVDSRLTLADGSGYDVRWLIVKRGATYKVRDAQVIGFWMTSFLDNLFQSFISDNGGNPKALVVALNR